MVGRSDLAIEDSVSVDFRILEQNPDLVGCNLKVVLVQFLQHLAPVVDALINCVPSYTEIIPGRHAESRRHLVAQGPAHHLVQPDIGVQQALA